MTWFCPCFPHWREESTGRIDLLQPEHLLARCFLHSMCHRIEDTAWQVSTAVGQLERSPEHLGKVICHRSSLSSSSPWALLQHSLDGYFKSTSLHLEKSRSQELKCLSKHFSVAKKECQNYQLWWFCSSPSTKLVLAWMWKGGKTMEAEIKGLGRACLKARGRCWARHCCLSLSDRCLSQLLAFLSSGLHFPKHFPSRPKSHQLFSKATFPPQTPPRKAALMQTQLARSSSQACCHIVPAPWHQISLQAEFHPPFYFCTQLIQGSSLSGISQKHEGDSPSEKRGPFCPCSHQAEDPNGQQDWPPAAPLDSWRETLLTWASYWK